MKKFHVLKWTVIFGILLVILTACSSASKGPTVVHVTLSDYKVEMDKTSIPAGAVRFEITNTGSLTHEVVLEGEGIDDEPFEVNGEASEAEDIASGADASLEWTIDTPGNYQLACHTSNHYQLGMVLPFTVK